MNQPYAIWDMLQLYRNLAFDFPTPETVEWTKLQDYLLSGSHPIGRFKAVFFGALGYTAGTLPAVADGSAENCPVR